MKFLALFFSFLPFQEEIPYKPSDEFQVKVDLKFKEKSSGYNPNSFTTSGERLDKPKVGLRAFLSVNVAQLKVQADESKIMAVDSQGKILTKKKVSPALELNFQMGFVEDLKSNAVASEITIYFLSPDKKELRKIVFGVLPNGVFQVNGQWHGQF